MRAFLKEGKNGETPAAGQAEQAPIRENTSKEVCSFLFFGENKTQT
jgi:hypothetical protein